MVEEGKSIGLFDYRPWTMKFKGKDVTMEIRPMKTKEMAIVLPLSRLMAEKWKDTKQDATAEDKAMMIFDDPEQIQSLFDTQAKAIEILPNAVRNLQGIEHDWKTICEEFYYMSFAIAVLIQLLSISMIGLDEAKN